MGLFSRNYNRPGPGVSKDEPRKKGVARFFELLFRDFWDLMKINMLFCLCVLPSAVMFFVGFDLLYPSIAFIVSFLLALALAFPIGGAMTAYVYYITKMMRDDPSYVWYEFKRKFKENFKQAAPVGVVCTAFVYTQIMLWVLLVMEEINSDLVLLTVSLASLVIFGMIAPYVFLHLAYVDLNTTGILKNSMLMSFGYLPRSFMGALLSGLIWIAFALFFPASLMFIPVIGLIGVSIAILLCMMWVWKPFDSHFKIEETLVARLEEDSEKE
ncbi:MAG: DUF624 domain-containing protein [Oscillospiraceae bacterium]|nr:DUF624 domain-containing protein [Oscillospiraceae bacterium]